MNKSNFIKIINSKTLSIILIVGMLSFLFGIIGGHLVSPFFFNHNAEFCYSELPEMDLTLKEYFDNKLKILWENKSIPDLKMKNIVFWNNSRLNIDNKSLKNGIRIIPSTECKILDMLVIKYSRNDLNILIGQTSGTTIQFNNGNSSKEIITDTISIKLAPKEILKYQDGVNFFIIYSSKKLCDFSMMRVDVNNKFIPFKKIEINKQRYSESNIDLLIILFIILPYIISLKNLFFPSLNLFKYLNKKYNKSKVNITLLFQVSIFSYRILLIPLILYAIVKIYIFIYDITIFPKWILS